MKRIALFFSVAGALALCALVWGRRLPQPATTTTTFPTLVEPKPPEPTPVAHGPGSLTVSAHLSDPLLAQGGVRDEYLKIDITGADAPEGTRAPVNLAVVLDRSGSMAGEKLESARRAAHALVDRLNGKDRLAFVTFGSNVTLLFPSQPCDGDARAEMHRSIDRIYDMGGTNLSGGLEAGLREVQAHQEGYAVNRVLLISDGEANEGITSREGLAAIARGALRQHVSVTALGVGVDFDEDTMQRLAENGGGNYRFLQTGAELEPIFNNELKQLATAVAGDATLHLQLAPGVSVAEVYGYSSESDSSGSVTIHLPDFSAGERRKVMVQLRAPAESLGSEKLLDAHLDYVDLLHGRQPAQAAWVSEVQVVPDSAQAAAQRDRETYAQVARVHAARVAQKAATLYSAGNVDDAERELAKGRSEALKLNDVAQDATFGAELDKVAPAELPAAAPSSSEGRASAKMMKQRAYDLSR